VKSRSNAALQRINMMSLMAPDGSLPPKEQGFNHAQTADVKVLVKQAAVDARLKPGVEPTELSRRVLLVESSPSETARIRNELIAGQIEVYTAGDVITAVHALPIHQPSLILSQLRLPIFGGMELIRRVKEDHATRSIPIILYSDIATAAERVQALDMGAVDLLTKPLISAELIARVCAALKAQHTLSVLERMAHLDGLTGLANRGVLEDQLLREWNSCRRRSAPLSVVMTDLDRFKAINDTYGHAAGDEVLRQTSRILTHSARSSDLIARYGGEEFVVVAADCPLTAALTLAKRFRANLGHRTIGLKGTDIRFTASIGIATTDWTQHSPSELLCQADESLYQAKRSGRDAIWVYDTSRRSPIVAVPSGSPVD
jgi:diguanylate cyclase (GGDEF)-like protein